MQPAGGTELQLAYLKKYANQGILDSVQITTSIPEKEPLDPIRANILWLKNSYDQPNLAHGFKIKKIILNMIGMFLIVIGAMKNIVCFFKCLKINVLL